MATNSTLDTILFDFAADRSYTAQSEIDTIVHNSLANHIDSAWLKDVECNVNDLQWLPTLGNGYKYQQSVVLEWLTQLAQLLVRVANDAEWIADGCTQSVELAMEQISRAAIVCQSI